MSVARATLAAAAALLALAASAPATSLPERTVRVSATPAGGTPDGASADPALSADGRTVAFATAATTLAPGDDDGATRDVVVTDLVTGERRVASAGIPADAGSPTISGDGRTVAFVAGDSLYVQQDAAAPRAIAVEGPAAEPALSRDGRVLAFAAGGAVFVHELAAGATTRIAPGAAPALSADGRLVAFASAAGDLVAGDTNGVADVFVHDRATGRTERVSVSSSGRQQDKAVAAPFTQVPDISADGRYVVFDSDATNLVRGDRNQRTDVFVRDRKSDRTRLVSLSSTDVQGDNDSFAPRLTPDGGHVAFQSFASNLTPGQDGAREDVFLRDLRAGGTTVITVADGGAPRGPERVRQLLQRPALADDAKIVAFSSTAPGLAPGDADEVQDVFLRLTEPPAVTAARRGGRVRLSADDARATRHLCAFDGGRPFTCGSSVEVRRSARVLTVRAGGPGMLFGEPVRLVLRAGAVKIAKPGRGPLRVVRGTAPGARRVEVAVTYLATKAGCRVLKGRRFADGACTAAVFVRARGTDRWSVELPRAIRGPVIVKARAVDPSGRRGRTVTLKAVV